MLSDKFVQEDWSSNENLSKQIIRLEELSISMTSLIESGNSHKIAHLETINEIYDQSANLVSKIISEDTKYEKL